NAARQPNGPIELYDLERDQSETTNVAAANPEIVRQIEAVMRSAHTPSVYPRWNFMTSSAARMKRWIALAAVLAAVFGIWADRVRSYHGAVPTSAADDPTPSSVAAADCPAC